MVLANFEDSAPPKSGTRVVLLTMARDEAVWFPVFLRYYSQHFRPGEIIVLDHFTADNSLDDGFVVTTLKDLPKGDVPGGLPFVRVDLSKALLELGFPEGASHHFCPDFWRPKVVAAVQHALLSADFAASVFVDCDEFLALDPKVVAPGSTLREYLNDFASGNGSLDFVAARGYEIHHVWELEQQPLAIQQPILLQRQWMFANNMYSKPCLARKAVPGWSPGFHKLLPKCSLLARHCCAPMSKLFEHQTDSPNGALLLLHLHRADINLARDRHAHYRQRFEQDIDPKQRVKKNMGWHYRNVDPAKYSSAFLDEFWGRAEDRDGTVVWKVRPWGCQYSCGNLGPIPEAWKTSIDL